MKKLKEKLKSVRVRLFFTLCVIIMFLVLCLVIINNLVLENFYMYSKTKAIKEAYKRINDYYAEPSLEYNLENEIRKIAYRNNFDILIKTDTNLILFSTDRDFLDNINQITNLAELKGKFSRTNVIYKDKEIEITTIMDNSNSSNYILLTATLVNDYNLYIRMPIAPIEESVRISNTTLFCIGILTIILSSFIASFISRKFTDPILQLNDITKKVSKLDFSQKIK